MWEMRLMTHTDNAGETRLTATRVVCTGGVGGLQRDALVLCHGGPISGVEEAKQVLMQTKGVHGFYGASSMERLPVETAIRETVKGFKSIEL